MSTVELVVSPGGEVFAAWWSPEVQAYLCALCASRACSEAVGGLSVAVCVNASRYCG